ncbi:MAG: heme o synthase [Anaerolineales bacterium]|jgi:protoheme IX farnesyltransferase
MRKTDGVQWLGVGFGLIFSVAVISSVLIPGQAASIAVSAGITRPTAVLLALGSLASLSSLGLLLKLWHRLKKFSVWNALALSSPLWVIAVFFATLLKLHSPDSGYLTSYQLAASSLAVIGLAAVALELKAVPVSPEPVAGKASWRDYLMLTKPIVVLLLLVTTMSAMIIAAGRMPPLSTFLWTALGGALSAGGASALNQYIDRERDSKMTRTQKRPLPGGRMAGTQAIGFGLLLCVAGFNVLALGVNLLSALMALVGIVYYVLLYSIVLKPTTAQNIVVGGGAGAIPPLVGWAAATNQLSMPAFFLFALIFFWTPPHFWALALLKNRDYERAGVPMFPVVYGEQETRVHILLYAIQLVALTMLLPLAGLGHSVYIVTALALGLGFLLHAWRLWKQGTNKLAWKMYRYSSMYLALIFTALVVDTLVLL